jgi:hypothetical protein
VNKIIFILTENIDNAIIGLELTMRGGKMINYTQEEFLEIMRKYNNMDRRIITINLSTISKKLRIKNKQVIEDTQYNAHKVNSWFALSSPNIPTFEDALWLAVLYNFDIKELIKD